MYITSSLEHRKGFICSVCTPDNRRLVVVLRRILGPYIRRLFSPYEGRRRSYACEESCFLLFCLEGCASFSLSLDFHHDYPSNARLFLFFHQLFNNRQQRPLLRLIYGYIYIHIYIHVRRRNVCLVEGSLILSVHFYSHSFSISSA